MNSKGRNRFAWMCTLPAFILYLIFMLYPTITIFIMSLFKWGGLSKKKSFIGLTNFKTLMGDRKFIEAFQNSIFLIVIVTIVTMLLAIFFAAILSREKIKGQNFFRVIFYIPNILSIAVVSSIFAAVFGANDGLINSFFKIFNPNTYTTIPFLGNKNLVIFSIAFAMIWQAVGYYMVMYMSTMSQIPKSLYEAADLDGASKWRQFIDVTLPLSWDTVRTTLTFYVISNINIAFQLVTVLTQSGPDGGSRVFLTYMYDQAYSSGNFGYGLAIGVIVFLFSFILTGIVNMITKRDIHQF